MADDCRACPHCARQCAASQWQSQFSDCTFPSEVIPLDNHSDFIAYLSSDHEEGLRLPEPPANVWPHDPRASMLSGGANSQGDETGESSDDDDASEHSTPTRKFALPLSVLESSISSALTRLGGSAFVKLEWSAPQDASWVMELGSVEACSAGDVFLLLKASDMIAYDLQLAEKIRAHIAGGDGNDATNAELHLSIVLRKWYSLLRSREFRCFVVGDQLRGVSQRHTSEYFSFLDEPAITSFRRAIAAFFDRRLVGRFPLHSCTLQLNWRRVVHLRFFYHSAYTTLR